MNAVKNFLLTLAVLFLASGAEAEYKQIDVNGRSVEWSVSESANGPEFKIIYSPYDKQLHEDWYSLRIAKAGHDPSGDRSYWKPASPELSGVFELELNPYSPEGWERIVFDPAIDSDVFSKVYPDLAKFVVDNKTTLEKTASSIAADLVKQGITIQMNGGNPSFLDAHGQFFVNEEAIKYSAIENILNPSAGQAFKFRLQQAQDYETKYSAMPLRTPIKKLPVARSLPNMPLLIVNHATEKWDLNCAGEAGINETIAKFKKLSEPVVYLMDDDGVNDRQWYTTVRNPSFALYSSAGEHDLPISNSDVTIVGGYFGQCLTTATQDAVSRYFLNHSKPLHIHLPMNSIYVQNYGVSMNTVNLSYVKAQLSGPQKAGASADYFGISIGDGFLGFLNGHLFTDSDGERGDVLEQLAQNGPVSGAVNFKSYQFKIFIDGKQVEVEGTGNKIVELRFE